VAAGLLAFLGGGGSANKADRKKLLAYEAKLVPLVKNWGKIEIDGMRPAIADLASGPGNTSVPPEAIAGEARAWQEGLTQIRADMTKLTPPASLKRAAELFDQSIVKYLAAAKSFEQAASSTGEAQKKGIEAGSRQAGDGATIYNDASLLLQRARHKVGLPTSPDFPDYPAGQSTVGG
jgi:hypothetical protein